MRSTIFKIHMSSMTNGTGCTYIVYEKILGEWIKKDNPFNVKYLQMAGCEYDYIVYVTDYATGKNLKLTIDEFFDFSDGVHNCIEILCHIDKAKLEIDSDNWVFV